MAKVDIYVEVNYDAVKEKISIGETNIKKERLKDFLLDWLTTQIGKGKDERKRIDRESYKVVIGCDLSFDTFYVKSNTGNDGLTCGIIIGAVNKLGD